MMSSNVASSSRLFPFPFPIFLSSKHLQVTCCHHPLLSLLTSTFLCGEFYSTSRSFHGLNFHSFQFSSPQKRSVPFQCISQIFKVTVAARVTRLGLRAKAGTRVGSSPFEAHSTTEREVATTGN